MKRTFTLFLLNAGFLIASAFLAAPYACDGGLAVYAAFGVAALVVQGVLGYGMMAVMPSAHRLVLAVLAVVLTIAIWFFGLFAADIRILCRLF